MPVSKRKAAIKPRKGDRRKLLDEAEFRRLVETGRAKESDRRSWMERRRKSAGG